MKGGRIYSILGIVILAAVSFWVYLMSGNDNGENSVLVKERDRGSQTQLDKHTAENGRAQSEATNVSTGFEFDTPREVRRSNEVSLPLTGSTPTQNVLHSIPIEEVRRGCFRQDCIPSVDDPDFVPVSVADEVLPEDTIGVGLAYNGETRFYPFNMLVTREIVNDTVAGDPLLVTYCPLCGTGIVFERQVDDMTQEFGVSGMLWQSNLLMYNRAPEIEDRSLWSQVLGEAVIGPHTGTKLNIVPSNIVRYTKWKRAHPDTEVLNTGEVGDPYQGDYYDVARSFDPDFDERTSPLDPTAYVHGVEVDGTFKAYADAAIPVGVIHDVVSGEQLTLERTEAGEVTISNEDGEVVPMVSGFWFSWVAAHPETELWQGD